MLSGTARNGARPAAEADSLPNSPVHTCWDRSRITAKEAASQQNVDPPLPSSTSYPCGGSNSSWKPSRTRATSCVTGAWLCDVPIRVEPTAASAADWAGRTRLGPEPNRPSAGRRSVGSASVLMDAIIPGPGTERDTGCDPEGIFIPYLGLDR